MIAPARDHGNKIGAREWMCNILEVALESSLRGLAFQKNLEHFSVSVVFQVAEGLRTVR